MLFIREINQHVYDKHFVYVIFLKWPSINYIQKPLRALSVVISSLLSQTWWCSNKQKMNYDGSFKSICTSYNCDTGEHSAHLNPPKITFELLKPLRHLLNWCKSFDVCVVCIHKFKHVIEDAFGLFILRTPKYMPNISCAQQQIYFNLGVVNWFAA